MPVSRLENMHRFVASCAIKVNDIDYLEHLFINATGDKLNEILLSLEQKYLSPMFVAVFLSNINQLPICTQYIGSDLKHIIDQEKFIQHMAQISNNIIKTPNLPPGGFEGLYFMAAREYLKEYMPDISKSRTISFSCTILD